MFNGFRNWKTCYIFVSIKCFICNWTNPFRNYDILITTCAYAVYFTTIITISIQKTLTCTTPFCFQIQIACICPNTCIFKQRIVHGFLSGSLISAVIGTILPGKGAIYLHQDMDFKKPVYIGEEITAVVEVERLKEEKRICYLQTRCENREGEVKISGSAIVKY